MGIESLGIPVPGETTLLVGVVLASQGRLSVAVVALCGWVGAVVGDNLGYLAGRRWGARLVTMPGLRHVYTERNLARADDFFTRRGWLAVFAGRFVALLRIVAGPLAGMHRMPWRWFVVANATGGAAWVTAVVVVGVLIGSNLDRAASLIARAGYVGLGLILLAVAGYLTLRWLRHRRAGA